MNRFYIFCSLAFWAFFGTMKAQSCADAGKDTTYCGLSYELIGNLESGYWTYVCNNSNNIVSLDNMTPGRAIVKVANCGAYVFVYHLDTLSCTSEDTVIINFENTSFRIEEINYRIGLNYPSTDCQLSPNDSCGTIRVLPGIIPPLPNWRITMDGKCEVFSAIPTIYGANSTSCIADSIIHDVQTKSIMDSVVWNTSQNGFITLDNDKNILNNRFNQFFNLISSTILEEFEIKCPLTKCFPKDKTNCADTVKIDTIQVIMPVHTGGNWYLKNDTVLTKLGISNYITINGKTHFLYVPMGGDYYGPNNISFELYATNTQLNPIPLQSKEELEIVWKESWKFDTIAFYLIREINEDKCFCNGTIITFGDFSIPSIPEFNCPPTRLVFIPEPAPHIEGRDFLCKGSNVNLTADKTYQQYQWNNGDVNPSTYYYKGGKVVLNVKDINGCSGADSLIIVEIDTPLLDIKADKKIICRGNCVDLYGITDAGSTIIWNVTDTTDKINVCPVSDAVYFIKAVNQSGCVSEGSVSIRVVNSPKPVLGKDLTLTCSKRSFKLEPIDPDLGFGRVSTWFGPGVGFNQKDSISITVNESGKYWFETRDTFNFCSGADTLEIFLDTIHPLSSAGLDQILNCKNTEVTLRGEASDTGTGFSLNWTGPGINGQNQTDVNPQVTKTGNYVLTIINLNNDCISKDTVKVSSNFTKPQANAGMDHYLYCDSLFVTLDGSKSKLDSNDIILWNGPGIDSSNRNTLRPKVNLPGKYDLIITNPISFCTDTTTVMVNAPDTIANIVLTKSGDFGCTVDTVILRAKESLGKKLRYVWEGPSGLLGTNNDSLIVLSAGKYYLYIYDSVTHCNDFDSIIINDMGNRPFVNAGPDKTISCELTTVILTGSVNIPLSSATIDWTGSGINGGNKNSLTPTVNKPGEYILRITDRRVNCTGFDTVYVTENLVPPALDLGIDQTINCINDSLVITAKIANSKPSFDFRWAGPGIVSANQRNNPQVIRIPGIYTASIVTPNPICTVYDTLQISIDTARPKLDLKDTIWFDCQNKLINYTVADFSKLDSVEWFDIFGKKIIKSDSGRSTSFVKEGIHHYVAHYKNGCTWNQAIVVIPYTIINVAKPIITPSCSNMATGTAKINILAGNGPFKLSLNGSREDTITFFTNLTPGAYKVRIFDKNGGNCFVDVFFDIPSLIVLPDSLNGSNVDLTICSDTTIFADTSFYELTQYRFPIDSVNFEWYYNDNKISPFSNKLIIKQPGVYQLVVINKNGCGNAKINFNARLDDSLSSRSFILPNVFTPGLTENNTYKAVNESGVRLGAGNYALRIYNRWGAVVFETENQDEAWDGTYHGVQAPPDTYMVILSLKTCQTGKTSNLKSSLNLIR